MTGSDGHLGSDAAVKDKTGQEARVLKYMWRKYAPHLDEFRPKGGRDKTKCYFYLIYVFIHLHPTARNVRNTLYTPQTGFISVSTWRRKLKPMLAKLASVVDEMRWENRLHRDNHSAFFQEHEPNLRYLRYLRYPCYLPAPVPTWVHTHTLLKG